MGLFVSRRSRKHLQRWGPFDLNRAQKRVANAWFDWLRSMEHTDAIHDPAATVAPRTLIREGDLNTPLETPAGLFDGIELANAAYSKVKLQSNAVAGIYPDMPAKPTTVEFMHKSEHVSITKMAGRIVRAKEELDRMGLLDGTVHLVVQVNKSVVRLGFRSEDDAHEAVAWRPDVFEVDPTNPFWIQSKHPIPHAMKTYRLYLEHGRACVEYD